MPRAKIQTEDGTILRAYLHSPGPGAHPGIIMCPGFGGVKPLIDTYAALFAEAGFAVLNHDQRGFGKLQSPRSYSPSTAGTSMPTRCFSSRRGPRPATGSSSTSECHGAATHLGRANR
jgi:dienelactone hydrolase